MARSLASTLHSLRSLRVPRARPAGVRSLALAARGACRRVSLACLGARGHADRLLGGEGGDEGVVEGAYGVAEGVVLGELAGVADALEQARVPGRHPLVQLRLEA